MFRHFSHLSWHILSLQLTLILPLLMYSLPQILSLCVCVQLPSQPRMFRSLLGMHAASQLVRDIQRTYHFLTLFCTFTQLPCRPGICGTIISAPYISHFCYLPVKFLVHPPPCKGAITLVYQIYVFNLLHFFSSLFCYLYQLYSWVGVFGPPYQFKATLWQQRCWFSSPHPPWYITSCKPSTGQGITVTPHRMPEILTVLICSSLVFLENASEFVYFVHFLES